MAGILMCPKLSSYTPSGLWRSEHAGGILSVRSFLLTPLGWPGRSRGGGVLDRGAGTVGLDRGDAIVAGGLGGIHLAGADDLAVRGLQDEVGLRGGGAFLFEVLGLRAVLADRVDPALGGGFGIITLAGKDDLVIAGLEDKAEFAGGPPSSVRRIHLPCSASTTVPTDTKI